MILQNEGNVISLRDPQLGDTYKPSLNIRLKTAMDGTRWAYSNPTNTVIVGWQFADLTRAKILELFSFITRTKGREITITIARRPLDGTSEIWKGRILSNPINSTELGNCNNDFNLEFEGELFN